MKDLLIKDLNPSQAEAVLCIEGPLIIFAGAGTGKTRVITHRIAYLLALGVAPWSILAVTFTNKAAAEMKQRVNDLAPKTGANVWVSTFHSFCAYFLRVEALKIELNPDFLIYDFSDQKNVIKDCLKELNIDEKKFKPSTVADKISRAKDDLRSPSDMTTEADLNGDFIGTTIATIYQLYQKKLERAGALDFGDLIMRTVSTLKQYPSLLEHYQEKYKYIMVDEYQDTNHAQYMFVKLLAQKHRNLCVVGDDDQCLPEKTLVYTVNGNKKIENISKSDILISAAGYGKTTQSNIEAVKKKNYSGLLVKIKTQSGKTITATPNHIGFAKLISQPNIHYVYLMYKNGMGYRIGQTKGIRVRTRKDTASDLAIRLNQEHADKMWILKICKDKDSATFYEQFLSVKYGIPTNIFNIGYITKGLKQQLKQFYCNKTFKEINTHKNIIKLMNDLNIFEEYPHHHAQAVIRGNTVKRIINLNLFSGEKTGKDRDRRSQLTENNNFSAMPFSHLKEGMLIPVLQNNKVIEDTIKEISYINYNGFVYDISVAHLRQFMANNVAVHNSVYSWRGADINNILDFEKDYPNAKSVKLEQNYRSTPKILATSHQVVKHNNERINKRLWTQNSDDGSVSVVKAVNENDEASKVVDLISLKTINNQYNFSDFAIFYRTNAQSRTFEDAFRRTGIPYTVIGTLRFYDRTEIKDIMAYLKLIHNPNDNVSFKRIINIPRRGIGKTSLESLEKFALLKNISIWQILPFVKEIGLTKGVINALNSFEQLIKAFAKLKNNASVKEVAEKVITVSGYLKELKNENTPESKTKIENIQELISAIDDFEHRSPDKSLAGYLTQVSLVSDIDSLDESKGKVTLMTLHLAKGLEFNNVFLCGLEEGLFPIGESAFNAKDLEEERRLMYVGMTRARKHLYLCWATERTVYGKIKWNVPSRFVAEAGFKDELIEREQAERQNSYNLGQGFYRTKWGNNFGGKHNYKKYAKAEVKYRDNDVYDYISSDDEIKDALSYTPTEDASPYKIGAVVTHPIFGKGKIIEKNGTGNDLKLVVLFETGQWKKLLARIANLTIVN
jgi:DNA helicase-2/ATP-dependent DNA helicase PcrA